MKEINRLISIGVLKWQPLSKWALPSFIIPKKDYTVHTISDFRELKKQIVRKPYPIPKISTTLQELEGFHIRGSVAPILNNARLYITGAGEYLEPGLFILDPWGFIVYNFLL